MKISDKIVNIIIHFKIWIIAFLVVISAFWAWSFSNISIDNELDIWFNKNSNDFNNFQDFKSAFGEDRTLMIIFKNDSLFSDYQLEINRELTTNFEKIDGVKEVISLTNISFPRISLFNVYSVKIIPEIINDRSELQTKVCNLDILIDNVISKDGKATVYHILVEDTANQKQVFDDAKLLLKKIENGNDYYLVGGIPIFEETARLSSEEPAFFLLLAILLMIAILFLLYRSLYIAVIPIAIALISIIWTLGLLYLVGGSINMLSGIIPLVMLVMNVAFSIHLISSFKKYITIFHDEIEAVKRTFQEVLKPATIATLTTSFAFLAFAFSEISPIRNFGLITSAGILFSYILTIIILPLVFIKFSSIFSKSTSVVLSRDSNFIHKLTHFVTARKYAIVIISFMVFIISVFGISKIKFETDQIKYFDKQNDVRIANDTASAWFNAVYPIELIFDISKMPKDSISKYYDRFKLLQNNLLQIDGVEACHSSLGVVQAVSVLNLNKFSEKTIFKQIIKGKVKSENKGMINYFISSNKDRFRLIIKSKYINNQQLVLLLPKIEQEVNMVFNQKNTPHYITGTAVLFGILSNDLLQSQILSLLFSFLIILLVFIIVFRKAKYFISGILPNILPVISSIGLMGFLGIHMDIGTILIASISLGVAVDDTVYLLISYKNSVNKFPHKNNIERSFNEVWQPLIITTLILTLGFLLLVFSSYTPIIYLGLFVSLNFVFALIYDFLLLPALLILFKID